jgi:plasmid maintenance system antidote protein VapI
MRFRSAMVQDVKVSTEVSLEDLIREAARESGLSVYRIAKDAQVDQPTLHKFLNGSRGNLRLDVAGRLFRVLGLKVVRNRRRHGQG